MRRNEFEIVIRQSDYYYEYYGEFEDYGEPIFKPCDAPSECVSADTCISGFDFAYSFFKRSRYASTFQ